MENWQLDHWSQRLSAASVGLGILALVAGFLPGPTNWVGSPELVGFLCANAGLLVGIVALVGALGRGERVGFAVTGSAVCLLTVVGFGLLPLMR